MQILMFIRIFEMHRLWKCEYCEYILRQSVQCIVYSGIKVLIEYVPSNCFITRFRAAINVLVGPCCPALLCSLNSDNDCRYSSQTRWRVTLWLSEHRRELAREACLRQLSDDDRLQWNTVRYSTRIRHNATNWRVKVRRKISTKFSYVIFAFADERFCQVLNVF